MEGRRLQCWWLGACVVAVILSTGAELIGS